VPTLLANLVRAIPAALAAGVLPGYFWAAFVRRTDGIGERLAYSAAVSMASVPAVALALSRILHTGVTLGVAIASVGVVVVSGWLACRLRGAAGGSADPALPRLPAITDSRVLALIIFAIGLALASALGLPTPGWLLIVILAALVIAGLLARSRAQPADRATGDPGTSSPATSGQATGGQGTGGMRPFLRPGLRAPALAAVLALTAVRAYTGVVRHDWPYLRGQDMFSHAVMTEQMLARGSYASYLVYPPGFSTTSAVICRFSGLPPLALFPVLAPALLLLTALAAYALATRLWGWDYGLVAAALCGLVLVGPNVSFGGGLYPDLLAAFFLMVMVVAALVTLYQSPSFRSGSLLALIGAAVVLYHSVGTLYLVLLLASVVVVCLPYLLLRGGQEGRAIARALALSLAALGVLSAAYAWHIYGLAKVLEPGAGTTRSTVGLDVGSQPALKASDLLSWVGSPVVWLGVFGFAALAVAMRYLQRPRQVACALTVLLWGLMMYVGSRTAIDGFPQRFERDVGAPLTVLAALGLGLILQSLARLQQARRAVPLLASPVPESPGRALAGRALASWVLPVTAAGVVVVIAGVQAGSDMVADSKPSREVLHPPVAAAGTWLRRHDTGGTIISTPDLNRGLTNRAVLAMGGYTGLQAYQWGKIVHPRSLPTAGRKPLLDSREVLLRPDACRSGSILVTDDVRYIFLYRFGKQADYAGFRAEPTRYRRVFENSAVVIYAPATVTTC
jgi:hypothetical protein